MTIMKHCKTSAIHTLVKTQTTRGNKTLVLSCGYSIDDKFGYFICWEEDMAEGIVCYSDFEQFFHKTNEGVMQQALHELNALAQKYKI